jgi:hypothetical protein
MFERHRNLLVRYGYPAVAAVFFIAAGACPAYAQSSSVPNIRSQGGGQTLELQPSQPSPQTSTPQQENDDNTRVIPVIPPNAQVLTLPEASLDFIGNWGGHLRLTRHYGRGHPPELMGTSMIFGEQNGGVVLATTVIGSPDMQVLETKAKTDGPRAVSLRVEGLDVGSQPPLRNIGKVYLELISKNEVKCTQTEDIYVSGFPDPIMETEFSGTLHPLTRREERLLGEEAAQSGVPRAQIREGNPPPQPSE